MSSIEWVHERRRVQPGRLYPSTGGMSEPVPTTCHRGHPFGPHRVTVGHEPCTCGGHRTYTCVECADVVQWPEPSPACDNGTFDGRGRNLSATPRIQLDMELTPAPSYEPPTDTQPKEPAPTEWAHWFSDPVRDADESGPGAVG
jgi:hypothetical protein